MTSYGFLLRMADLNYKMQNEIKQEKDRDGRWIQVAGRVSLSTRTGDGDGVKVESGLLD